MLDSMFTSVFSTGEILQGSVTSGDFLLCSITSLTLGCFVALIYMFKHRYSRSFVLTIAILPIIVQMVITLVNGNLGAGIAVMGVFNLVRFCSIPGSAKDIGTVFFAMAIGLATGMGYLTLAVLFAVIVGIANVAYTLSPFGRTSRVPARQLKLAVPEAVDYPAVLSGIFEEYTTGHELVDVRVTDEGSMYQLKYEITLKDSQNEKSFIDDIRIRTGSTQISCGRISESKRVL